VPSGLRQRAPEASTCGGVSRHGAHGAASRNGTGAAGIDAAGRQGAHVLEMQRRRLLSALMELAAEQGLEGASIGRICKRAGVSRRTFYELFEDRDACLLAAFDEALGRISTPVLVAYQTPGSWRERTRAALAALLARLDAEPGLARLCLIEALRAGPDVIQRRRRVLEQLAEAIDGGRAQSRHGDAVSSLTAQGVVGGALSVVHASMLDATGRPLVELVNPLMAMIVHPYLGPMAARRELRRRPPEAPPAYEDREGRVESAVKDPFRGLPIRFTYRTARVLATIASEPGASNRAIADVAGIGDEGQMSRLLRRLERSDLIENRGDGHAKGEPNAWTLTERGQAVHAALGAQPR
jgi:AcrR family transcriptional regulator/DNA-binding MarR family transcriptional regulator